MIYSLLGSVSALKKNWWGGGGTPRTTSISCSAKVRILNKHEQNLRGSNIKLLDFVSFLQKVTLKYLKPNFPNLQSDTGRVIFKLPVCQNYRNKSYFFSGSSVRSKFLCGGGGGIVT